MNKDNFLSTTNYNFSGKTVLVRIDCDVDLMEENGKLIVDEDFRLRQAMPAIELLKEKGAGKIILLGHLGRPEGKIRKEMELEAVGGCLHSLMQSNFQFSIIPANSGILLQLNNFQSIFNDSILKFEKVYKLDKNIYLLENLRFDKREEENDEEFAKELAGLGDVYVNEAFGVSHRNNASITGIPKYLPSFLGLNFEREIEVLTRLRSSSYGEARGKIERPLVFVLGGSKKDKLDYLEFLGEWYDKVLVGGKLPNELKVLTADGGIPSKGGKSAKFKIEVQSSKLLLAELKVNGKDLNEEDIKLFKEEINKAKTIIFAGPMGVYEEEENRRGTFEIAKAIVESPAGYKIAGGGDTHRILSWLGIWNKFNFVSCGGGAMLAFLKNATLAGITSIIH